MAKFSVGPMVMTAGIAECIKRSRHFAQSIEKCVQRYLHCDWGNMCREDKDLNDNAVKSGDDRILARYETCEGPVYIITEWDHSLTTILFANEY